MPDPRQVLVKYGLKQTADNLRQASGRLMSGAASVGSAKSVLANLKRGRTYTFQDWDEASDEDDPPPFRARQPGEDEQEYAQAKEDHDEAYYFAQEHDRSVIYHRLSYEGSTPRIDGRVIDPEDVTSLLSVFVGYPSMLDPYRPASADYEVPEGVEEFADQHEWLVAANARDLECDGVIGTSDRCYRRGERPRFSASNPEPDLGNEVGWFDSDSKYGIICNSPKECDIASTELATTRGGKWASKRKRRLSGVRDRLARRAELLPYGINPNVEESAESDIRSRTHQLMATLGVHR